jgi:hypothetical protein
MLQQDLPDDYVIATGETHTLEEFTAAAFACVSLIGGNMSKLTLSLPSTEITIGGQVASGPGTPWLAGTLYDGMW